MWPKRLLPYVGLPNVLAGEFIVPELLQEDATAENIAQALLNLLSDTVVQRRLEARFEAMRVALRCDAAANAARAILPMLAGAA
jgi:lipid-A-disaccharide synthase